MNKVVLYCFKAHTSHIWQPNDLEPFKPLKQEWRTAGQEWRVKYPYIVITKVEFTEVLAIAISKLNPTAIISGYRVTGFAHLTPVQCITTGSQIAAEGVPVAKLLCIEEPGMIDENQITLRNIELYLGEKMITKYSRLYHIREIAEEDLKLINVYLVWHHFKYLCDVGSAIDHDSVGLMNDLFESEAINEETIDSDLSNCVANLISSSSLEDVPALVALIKSKYCFIAFRFSFV